MLDRVVECLKKMRWSGYSNMEVTVNSDGLHLKICVGEQLWDFFDDEAIRVMNAADEYVSQLSKLKLERCDLGHDS